MRDPQPSFDPYSEWLQISEANRPPDLYALLGLDLYETDEHKIDAAAKQRVAYLHQLAAGPHRAELQRLLSEIAAARRTLVNSKSREIYDAELREPASSASVPIIDIAADQDDRRPRRSAPSARRQANLDRRIYVLTACSVLLASVAAFFLYTRSHDARVAAKPNQSSRLGAQSDSDLKVKRKRTLDILAQASQPQRLPKLDYGTESSASESVPRRSKRRPKPVSGNVVTLPNNWLREVPMLCDFSGKEPPPFDTNALANQGVNIRRERLEFPKSASAQNSVLALSPAQKLEPGNTISIRTRFPGRNKKVRLGISACGYTLVMRIEKTGKSDQLTLRAHDDEVKDGELLGKFDVPGKSDVSLAVIRPETDADQLWWIVNSKKKTFGGRFESQGLQPSSEIGIVWFNGNKDLKPPLWLDDIRLGTTTAPPALTTTSLTSFPTR